MYRLHDVSHSYGQAEVLHISDASIPSDQFVAVVGPSGSGKSSLLRLLSFVETPTRGEILLTLGSQAFASASTTRPWPKVTCVFQKQFLWPHLTLRQNILLPLTERGIAAATTRVAEVVNLFEMTDFVDRYPNEVSGGQAQRAALARALVLNPELVLIDEPHSGLDLDQQEIINSHLSHLRKAGVGIILVTHSLGFAKAFADFLIVLENGTISEAGPISILDRPQSEFLRRVSRYP